MHSHAHATRPEKNSSSLLQRKPALRIGEKDDAYEKEADRTADAIINGGTPGIGRTLSKINISSTLQREQPAKPKSEEEKYKEAAKKLGEAFLETGPGKEIKEKAKKLGEAFISTLPGKIITGSAITGAVAALAATHKELPIGIPEIPLDMIRPGLKLKLTYEGPVDKPTKVMASFSIPLGAPKASKKPAMTKAERFRAETARMAEEQYQFRESMKTPEQRAEDQRMMDASIMSRMHPPGSPLSLGIPGIGLGQPTGGLPPPLAPYAPEFKITGERPKTEEPKKKEEEATIQRKSNGASHDSGTPAIVNEVLQSPGRPLERNTRSFMESRFGHDFSHVRVHTDTQAGQSAQAIDALAYTVGHDLVFANGKYSPATPQGQNLLAHELTHVIQQGQAQTTSGQTLQRKGGTIGGFINNLGRSIVSIFADEPDFDDAELLQYLATLDTNNDIEDDFDSDDKARVIVRAWVTGTSPYILTPSRIKLLIKEMQSDFTGDDDEKSILELLERCENNHLNNIFGTGGISLDSLNSDFQGEEWDRLQDFYERRFVGGLSAMRQGQIQARGRAVPLGIPLSRRGQRPQTSRSGERIIERSCNVRTPGNCHTYEQWIQLFQPLGTFTSGHSTVLGPSAAPANTATDPSAGSAVRRPFVRHSRSEFMPHDRFIDGPTEQWVRQNLPANLVATAYELPSDCADMAVILRHVWLVAHRRTEVYRGWLCGTALNNPRTREMRRLLLNTVWSGNVGQIARPYQDPAGNNIRDFPTLQRLLHPGDVLVWDHPAPRGGHTHTVMQIHRSGEQVTRLDLLQGNQPIDEPEARNTLIHEYGFSETQLPAGQQQSWPARAQRLERELRSAPGRRIEIGRLEGANLPQTNTGVWIIWGGSQLVAAGPPASSEQPTVRRGRVGQNKIRGLSDWQAELATAANQAILQSRVEAALLETRSLLEAGHTGLVSENDASTFGRIAGERLWTLANESARTRMRQAERRSSSARIRDRDLLGTHLGEESHYRPLQHIVRMMQQIGRAARVDTASTLMSTAARAFELAARGTSSIRFSRSTSALGTSRVAAGARLSRILLTGFDPFGFNQSGQQIEPRRGRFNPSGAAILQLDGTTIPVETNRAAAIEGAILPVDYRAFNSGTIESQLGPQVANSDAVITVSESPGVEHDQPLRVERFAVGVHKLNNGRLEAIPAAPGASSRGPAIIETGPGTEEIVQQTNQGVPQAQRPVANVGNTVRFRFTDITEANRALRALGLTQQAGSAEVDIDNISAIRKIVATMERGVQSPGITFETGNQSFQAIIVRGPGGSFLSNEVSYRMLRMIAASGRTTTSFHVHTPRGTRDRYGRIPQDVTGDEAARTRARQQGRQRPTAAESRAARTTARQTRFDALELGRRVVRRVVEGLKALIKSVVRRLP